MKLVVTSAMSDLLLQLFASAAFDLCRLSLSPPLRRTFVASVSRLHYVGPLLLQLVASSASKDQIQHLHEGHSAGRRHLVLCWKMAPRTMQDGTSYYIGRRHLVLCWKTAPRTMLGVISYHRVLVVGGLAKGTGRCQLRRGCW